MKLYMFRTVPLSIIRSLFTVHSAMVYVIHVCGQLSSRARMELISISSTILAVLESCPQTSMTYAIAECAENQLLMMNRVTVGNT